MKLSDATKYLDSQKIRIGIGFFFTGKKLSDYGEVFNKPVSDFATPEEYAAAKEEFEKPAMEKMEAEKQVKDKEVELIFRQPTLDELMAITKQKKKLPVDLNLNVPEIAKVALEYMGSDDMKEMDQIANTLVLMEKCYEGNTFEGGEKLTGKEAMNIVRKSKDLSVDVVQQFFEQVGK